MSCRTKPGVADGARDVPDGRQIRVGQHLDDLVCPLDLRRRVRDHRGHRRAHHRKRSDEIGDTFVGALDVLECFVVDGLQIPIDLLVEHQLFTALRPNPPRIVVDDVGNDELSLVLAPGQPPELDLQIDQQDVALTPRMRENIEGQPREFGHNADFLRRREVAGDDLIGRNHRIVRRIVFEKELDDARNEQRAALQARDCA